MKFTSKRAYERYAECRQFAYDNGLKDNFNEIFSRLLLWERYDEDGDILNEITIGTDWENRSFTFSEHYTNGVHGISGGIIFHGLPGAYEENGSVQMNRECGWQIHT